MSAFFSTGVTFGEFSAAAKKQGFTQESLIEVCKPWWEGHDPVTAFAKRVFTPMHKDVVIPYRPLLQLYAQWEAVKTKQDETLCACGCGRPVRTAYTRFATRACRTGMSASA